MKKKNVNIQEIWPLQKCWNLTNKIKKKIARKKEKTKNTGSRNEMEEDE